MSKATNNPYLKQLVTDISRKANQGRLDINWGVLEESRKKKAVKEGNIISQVEQDDKKRRELATTAPEDEKPADEKPADDIGPQGATAPAVSKGIYPEQGKPTRELPPTDKSGAQSPVDSKSSETPAAPVADQGGEEAPPADDKSAEEPSPEAADAESPKADANQAQDDASKAKAELEKAKAEKDQAEKEIKKQSYVHLISSPGVHFLLAKLVDHAFKTNTIDGLASEMVNKLKIQTPEDFGNFAEEMAPYKVIPGVSELLASMKGMATKQPEAPAEAPAKESMNEQEGAWQGSYSKALKHVARVQAEKIWSAQGTDKRLLMGPSEVLAALYGKDVNATGREFSAAVKAELSAIKK